MNYDVVILGGGPAGIAAAITLSGAGVSTVLIEKNIYPREKTCAGILTQKTVSFLEKNFSFTQTKHAFSANQVTTMYQRNNMGQFKVQFPFVFVHRQIFDFELLNICQKNGAHVMEGLAAVKLFPDENKIMLSNNQSITYKSLIAADGVFSPTRKQLGLANVPTAFCIQDTIERKLCPQSLSKLQEIQVNFGDVSMGYSWIVPYQEHIAVGTGIFTKQFDYPDLLTKHNMLCKHLDLPEAAQRRGAFVPIGGFENQTEHPYENIVFTGDAAGLVNPLTGEGIYHALLSGLYAGKSYLLNYQKFRTTYLSLLQPMIEQLKEQQSLLSKFYNPTLLSNILFNLKDCPEYLSTVCDNVVSLEKQSYYSLIMELQQLFR
ncbi:MAG: geranylgeranyl reductase family protein [Butyrivibrio sp.]|nr:geranylgeranyl reductase family protein [Butyrivibrio sp.]